LGKGAATQCEPGSGGARLAVGWIGGEPEEVVGVQVTVAVPAGDRDASDVVRCPTPTTWMRAGIGTSPPRELPDAVARVQPHRLDDSSVVATNVVDVHPLVTVWIWRMPQPRLANLDAAPAEHVGVGGGTRGACLERLAQPLRRAPYEPHDARVVGTLNGS